MDRSRFDNPGYNQEHGEPFDVAEAIGHENAERAEAEQMWAAEEAERRQHEGGRETRVRVTWESQSTVELPLGWQDGDPIPEAVAASLDGGHRRIVRVERDDRF